MEGLTEKLRPHSEKHFGPGIKLNRTIVRKIIEVYTGDAGLGQLGLIALRREQFARLNPVVQGPWKTPVLLARAYEKAKKASPAPICEFSVSWPTYEANQGDRPISFLPG